MKTLQNGLTVFNATPHQITFSTPDGGVEVVEPDTIINATPKEEIVSVIHRQLNGVQDGDPYADYAEATLVRINFMPDEDGYEIIKRAKEAGADVIVGSLVAAQTYPGDVVAMTSAPGFERVPAPLPPDVMAALRLGAQMSSVENEIVQALEKYENLPTKRMNPDKFIVYPPTPDPIAALLSLAAQLPSGLNDPRAANKLVAERDELIAALESGDYVGALTEAADAAYYAAKHLDWVARQVGLPVEDLFKLAQAKYALRAAPGNPKNDAAERAAVAAVVNQ